jgi:6,7-dimethyl-8-ribityllumazine synthase
MSDQHDEFPPAEPGPAVGTGEPPTDIQRTIAYPPPPAYPETTVFAAAEPEAVAGDEPPEEAPHDEPDAAAEPAATTVEEEPDVAEQAVEAGEGEDPFGDWPQPESAAVIEDVPESGAAEHVAGEIDVPDGYTVLEGTPSGLRRSVAVVVSRYNGGLTNKMLARAIEALEEAGVAPDAVTIMPVPGAFELPLAAMALAKTRRYACVVALGAIVRGETAHFDFVASEAASGLQLAAIETGVPVAFGVLTVDTVEQAEARIDRAADAVHTALEMADVFAQLRASARS